jgi:hypothetical protein
MSQIARPKAGNQLGGVPLPGSAISTDNFIPKTTPYTAPILFGGTEHGAGGEPRQIVFIPRDGQEGAWFEFNDQASVILYNGVKNYVKGGWGAVINYHRHDNAAVTVGSGSKTTISTSLQSAFGADAAHLGSTRGSYWTYTQTCSKLFINAFRFASNGGNLLIAVDNNPFPNGRNLKTVTAAQVATAEFNATVLSGLPAPWNTLATLEGCKYIDCYSDAENEQWNEIWSGAEGSHVVRACETATNSALGATCRAYISAFGYISTSDAAVTATYAPARPSANTSGRTFAPYMKVYHLLSMQHLIEQWRPSGGTNFQFIGGNHTDGSGNVSNESASTGYFTHATLTSASSAVSAAAGTDDIQDGDRLLALGNQLLQLTVQTPSGKTASAFNLTAAPTIANTTSASPFRMLRADWTITSGATSATQAFTGTHLPVAGDAVWIIGTSTSVYSTVKSVSGSNVTLDASVTTATGDWVVLLGCAESHSLLTCQDKAYLARPYEFIVMPVNSLIWRTRSMRSHPDIGTTLSSAAARGDTTIAVTSATNLVGGSLIAIYGATGRFVTRISDVSGTTITLARKLPFGFASASRVTYGLNYDASMRFEVGDTFSAEYEGELSEYRQGDEAQTCYTSMMTVTSLYPNGFTYTLNGTPTIRTWVNSNADSGSVAMSSAVMSGRGTSSVMRVRDSSVNGSFQTRGAEALSKVYFSSGQNHSGLNRFPNSVIRGGFSLDFRNVVY